MIKETSETRFVQNVGSKPYNIPLAEIARRIEEVNPRYEIGVLVLKPGCFSKDHNDSRQQNLIEALFSACELEVVVASCVALDKLMVHQLYPDIYDPNVIAKSENFDKLQESLENYMSDYVFSYLVYGENALSKLGIIKETIRKSIRYKKGKICVENVVHVPDKDSIYSDINILFSSNDGELLDENNI